MIRSFVHVCAYVRNAPILGPARRSAQLESTCFHLCSLFHLYSATEPPPIEIASLVVASPHRAPTPLHLAAARRVAPPPRSKPCLPPRRAHSSFGNIVEAGIVDKSDVLDGARDDNDDLLWALINVDLVEASSRHGALLRLRARAAWIPRLSSKVTFAQSMLQVYVSSVLGDSSRCCKCFILMLQK
jgi:hypothetical protein